MEATAGGRLDLVEDVLAVAEGEEDDVKDFLSWAHAGPSTARVDDVDVRWRSYTGEYTDFRITR